MARKYGTDNTHLTLTEKANRGYSDCSEIQIFEIAEDYDENEFSLDTVYSYDIRFCGVWERGLTEQEVNKYLEDIADEEDD